jgi:hypothetical protein
MSTLVQGPGGRRPEDAQPPSIEDGVIEEAQRRTRARRRRSFVTLLLAHGNTQNQQGWVL